MQRIKITTPPKMVKISLGVTAPDFTNALEPLQSELQILGETYLRQRRLPSTRVGLS
jgi:hypothetical protein